MLRKMNYIYVKTINGGRHFIILSWKNKLIRKVQTKKSYNLLAGHPILAVINLDPPRSIFEFPTPKNPLNDMSYDILPYSL
jgi:hypothetical protein